MDDKIIEFYDKHFGGIGGFIASGRRRGLDPHHIRLAACVVYDTHHNGKPYKSLVQMGQQVLAQAHKFEHDRADRETLHFAKLEKRIEELERRTPKERVRRLFEGYTWL